MCDEIGVHDGFEGEKNSIVMEQYGAELIESTISTLFTQSTAQACHGNWVQVLGDGYELVMFFAERGS